MRRLWLKLFRRRALHRELEAEMAFHREMAREQGNPVPFGNRVVVGEQALDLWRFNFLENLWRDLVYGARGLRRNPALLITALVSLGLGIGVNAAMFSLGTQLLFSVPSVSHPESLVYIRLGGNSHAPLKALRLLRDSGIFADVTGVNEESNANFNDGHETHHVFAVYTAKNFFTSMGVPMLHGRGLRPDDPAQTVVLRYRFWRKYFNGDIGVPGRAVNLDGRLCTVVGILPEHQNTFLGFGYAPDLYLPQYMDDTGLAIYARLKPGMSLPQATAAVLAFAPRLDTQIPGPQRWAVNTRVAAVAGFGHLTAEKETMTVGIFFAILLTVCGLVLSIACVNVANLLLARGAARRHEIAVRLALGAGRGGLAQQAIAESLLLATAGAAVGFALSQVTARVLSGIQLPLPLPIEMNLQPDWRLAVFGALLIIFAAAVCGLLPAWQSARESLARNLPRERTLRWRRFLVSAQVAISVVVLTTGFLFLRNLVNAGAITPGFDVRNTIRADVNFPPEVYNDPARVVSFAGQALRQISELPGVESAAAARIIPFTDSIGFGTELRFPDTGAKAIVYFRWNGVTADFFRAMNIPLLKGRTFEARERGSKVVIVNRRFVERYLKGREALGTRFIWARDGETSYQIVGVVEGTKTMTIGEEAQPQLYEPLDQFPMKRSRLQFVVRSAIPPSLQLKPLRDLLHRLSPSASAEVETLYSSIGLAYFPSQVGAVLMGSIGAMGLLLASVGLYGVMLYSVTRRRREIGVRMAIGATRGRISRMVLVDSARLTLTGSAVGLFVAVFVTRPLAMFLVPGLKASDPVTFLTVAVLMIATGLAASWGPVRKAASVDPQLALRED